MRCCHGDLCGWLNSILFHFKSAAAGSWSSSAFCLLFFANACMLKKTEGKISGLCYFYGQDGCCYLGFKMACLSVCIWWKERNDSTCLNGCFGKRQNSLYSFLTGFICLDCWGFFGTDQATFICKLCNKGKKNSTHHKAKWMHICFIFNNKLIRSYVLIASL